MKTIKTRNSNKNIKILDKSVNLSKRMKDATIRTKERAEEMQVTKYSSPDDYAVEKVTQTVQRTTRNATDFTTRQIKIVFQRDRIKNEKFESPNQPKKNPQTPTAEQSQSLVRNSDKNGVVNEFSVKENLVSDSTLYNNVQVNNTQTVNNTQINYAPTVNNAPTYNDAPTHNISTSTPRNLNTLANQSTALNPPKSREFVEQSNEIPAQNKTQFQAKQPKTRENIADTDIVANNYSTINPVQQGENKSISQNSGIPKTPQNEVINAPQSAIQQSEITTPKAVKSTQMTDTPKTQNKIAKQKLQPPNTNTPLSEPLTTPSGKALRTTPRTAVKSDLPLKISEKSVKSQVSKSTKKSIKKSAKRTAKTAQKTVKTAQKTAKTAAKTTQQTAKATAKAAKVTAQTAKAAAKTAVTVAKAAVKATIALAKAAYAAIQSLVTAIAAGGWVAVLIIILICLIGLLVGSMFGIFFADEPSADGKTINSVIREIDAEYSVQIDEIINANPHDLLDMSGARASWRDVLAVYAVKTTNDNAMDVATIDDTKAALLRSVFWEMNSIAYELDTTDIEIDILDEDRLPTGETEIVTQSVLRIAVSHITPENMGFSGEQAKQLDELLKPEYISLWNTLLYGVSAIGDGSILEIAASQIGNIGGEIYWRWYGFSDREPWCAIFVNWCAEQGGYINAGTLPLFAGTGAGIDWFTECGQWRDNIYTPNPGDLIFFDWENDGTSDHVGLVESADGSYVHTIEGNTSDSVARRTYEQGSVKIVGYGVPIYALVDS